jgi:hypothetical protein
MRRTGNAKAMPRIDDERAKARAGGCGMRRTGIARVMPRIDGERATPAQKET